MAALRAQIKALESSAGERQALVAELEKREAALAKQSAEGSRLAAALQDAAQRPVARSVLVKGSRFMKMEQVVQALRTAWGDAPCC